MEDYELVVRHQNPDFYNIILPLIPSIPEYRPMKTVEKMKKEQQNPWRIIVEELTALSLYPLEDEFLCVLKEENSKEIDKYMIENSPVPGLFFEKYTILSFLLSQLLSKTLVPLLLAYEKIDLISDNHEFTIEDIRYVRSEKILNWVIEKNCKGIKDMTLAYAVLYPGTTLYAVTRNIWTPIQLLEEAVKEGSTEIISIIRSVPVPPYFTLIHLHNAIKYSNLSSLDVILSSKEVDLLFPHRAIQESVFKIAIPLRNLKIFERLIKDPYIDPSCSFNMPLSMAVKEGYVDIVEMLLKSDGLRLEKDNGSLNILLGLIKKENETMVELLINNTKIQEIIKDLHVLIAVQCYLGCCKSNKIKDLVSPFLVKHKDDFLQ